MKALSWIFRLLIVVTLGALLPSLRAGSAAGLGAQKGSEKTQSATSAAPKNKPSQAEIADAKTKGLVWVNLATHVYHKEGPSFGSTKRGKFMTEEEAKKAGFRMANGSHDRRVTSH